MLQQFLAAAASHSSVAPLSFRKAALESVDSWLEHRAAAEYLGVGRSTLYRYAEGEQIESRKFGGRLEYRLSSLDEFKARHVRPARRSGHESGIIQSAPRSGK
jgi:excisionase family DNA binding protein